MVNAKQKICEISACVTKMRGTVLPLDVTVSLLKVKCSESSYKNSPAACSNNAKKLGAEGCFGGVGDT